MEAGAARRIGLLLTFVVSLMLEALQRAQGLKTIATL
jgi:hypothetical protein